MSTLQHRQGKCCAGYFGRSHAQLDEEWVGTERISIGSTPALGPAAVHPQYGICTIGATPWVVNYNVVLKDASMPAGAHAHVSTYVTKLHCHFVAVVVVL